MVLKGLNPSPCSLGNASLGCESFQSSYQFKISSCQWHQYQEIAQLKHHKCKILPSTKVKDAILQRFKEDKHTICK